MLDISKISAAVSYDPETGALTWKGRCAEDFDHGVRTPEQKARIFNSHYEGKPALSSKSSDGYLVGTWCGKHIKAHRVAWAIYYGAWPQKHIDHINGDRSDNRISNLREASMAENSKNAKKPAITNPTSKYKGVSKEGRKWKSVVTADGVRTYIGMFDDEKTAAIAYDLVASVLHGDFCNPNIVNDKEAMREFMAEYARKHHKSIPQDIVKSWTEKVAY